LRRVSEIVGYISRDRPEAAQEWAEGVFRAVDQLESFPGQGRVVPEVGRPSIREVIYGEYRVIYKVQAKAIGVLTVRHGRRRFDPRGAGGRR
jgi:plasmid stabilization system protein ParE